MARLARLVLAGEAHLVIQRGHRGQAVFADITDRRAFVAALHEAAAAHDVALHACALLPSEVQLLATPAGAASLSRMMQALGRRYVSAYNRRHGCSGTLWDGRFRCAVIEGGPWRHDALLFVDGASADAALTSAAHRAGGLRDARLVDPPEYWQLGNTPFEREAAWGRLLDAGLPPARSEALRAAALGGWAAGSAGFAARVAEATARPAQPRPRGRPRNPAT